MYMLIILVAVVYSFLNICHQHVISHSHHIVMIKLYSSWSWLRIFQNAGKTKMYDICTYFSFSD